MNRPDFGETNSVTLKLKFNFTCDLAISFLFPLKKMKNKGSYKKLYKILEVENNDAYKRQERKRSVFIIW